MGKFIIWFILIAVVGCKSQKYLAKDFNGDYINESNSNKKLNFKETDFCFVDPGNKHHAWFFCCDTITIGKWELKENLIELTTPQLNQVSLGISVEESKLEPEDTIYFYLSNPVEDHYKYNSPGGHRYITYHIYIKAKESFFFDRHVGKEYNSDIIAIYKPKNIQIEEFAVWVYISGNYWGRNIGVRNIETEVYSPKSSSNNVFKVTIPQLSYEFLTYLRLEKDFIKVLNKKKLEWDGKIYTKK
ncbi:MAG: hypothetical protein AAB221_06055 [Bacteroidota bacterium]